MVKRITMKILIFSPKEATFKLDGVDIGDYIEAEFVADLGIVDQFECMGKTVPVFGYELLLTLSANDAPPELVEYRAAGVITKRILEDRQQGEFMAIRPIKVTHRLYQWNQLVVNGETTGLMGRTKVK